MIDGYAIFPGVLSPAEVASLIAAVGDAGQAGVRNLLVRVPSVMALAESRAVRGLVEPILGSHAVPVRGILFDKSPSANWKVPWHQDLTIAVEQKVEVSGFGPWTVKDGIPHVQPPAAILERMLAVRIHLDECTAGNGALRVIPTSHLLGRLGPEQIQDIAQTSPAVLCEVPAGGVLLMRPLLLHASSPAVAPRHRRIIHIEFAAAELPAPLRWHSTAQPAS